jgi:hypothetical protein
MTTPATTAAASLAPSRRPSTVGSSTVDPEKTGADSASSLASPAKGEKVAAQHTLATVVEDVFSADVVEGEPDYRGVKWPQAFVLLLKSQIGECFLISELGRKGRISPPSFPSHSVLLFVSAGLGVLSLPHVMLTLGFVPGMLCLLVLGAMT